MFEYNIKAFQGSLLEMSFFFSYFAFNFIFYAFTVIGNVLWLFVLFFLFMFWVLECPWRVGAMMKGGINLNISSVSVFSKSGIVKR